MHADNLFPLWEKTLHTMTITGIPPQELSGWRRFFRALPPKLVILPAWWPWHGYGAWSYMRYILVSRELVQDAPETVRRYVLGHELGHIRFGHTALNYMYLFTSLAFILATGVFIGHYPHSAKMIAAIIMLLLLIPKSALLWFPSRREYQADRYAVAMTDRKTAIQGSLWMAEHGRDISKLRRNRLLRLGYTVSTAQDYKTHLSEKET